MACSGRWGRLSGCPARATFGIRRRRELSGPPVGVMPVVYVLVPLMLVVAAALAWTWWLGHEARDPVSSIHSFHRALEAMQPQSAQAEASHSTWENAPSSGHAPAREQEMVRVSR